MVYANNMTVFQIKVGIKMKSIYWITLPVLVLTFVFSSTFGASFPHKEIRPLETVLNPDGTINTNSSYSGSLDPEGYRMILKSDGTPVFVPRQTASYVRQSTAGDEDWDLQFTLPGVDGQVLAIAQNGSDVYLGGSFIYAGNVEANYVCKWTGASWSALGSGFNSSCNALAWDATNSLLYAGGAFTGYVRKFDGFSWTALGSGVDGVVYAVTISGTDVYVGGNFNNAGGASANKIAKWDGSNWSALVHTPSGQNGVNGIVRAITVSNGNVYVGGLFAYAGGDVAASNIAYWNIAGSTWNALGAGVNSQVSAIAVDGSNIYAAGNFTTAGGNSAKYIAKYDGADWSALGTGLDNIAKSILLSGTKLYVAGNFTKANDAPASYVAYWDIDAETWNTLGAGFNSSASVISGSSLYFGGTFTTAGTVAASCITRWNGSSWETISPGYANGINGIEVDAITVNATDIYVGGNFTTAGSLIVNNVAKWNGMTWSALVHTPTGQVGVNGTVKAIAVNGSNVYIGGSFTWAGGEVNAKGVTRFDGSKYYMLGTGLNDGAQVNAIGILDASNVFVGGSFSTAGSVSPNNIAKFDGTNWSVLGTEPNEGVNGIVYAIVLDGSTVYVGGGFTTAGGIGANRVAKWSEAGGWATLGDGVDGNVYGLAMMLDDLVAVGGFTTAGGSSAGYIAMWDGSSWSTFGSSQLSDEAYAVGVSGSTIYVGGAFEMAGGVAVNGIAKYEKNSWAALGSGTNNWVYAIGLGSLYIGGDFDMVGGIPSFGIAKYSDVEDVVLLQTKIFLEGAYNAADDAMLTSLNPTYLPLTAPYSENVRTVTSIPADVTDWVLVQVRTTYNGAAVTSKSAFLHMDGRIVADDGTTGIISLACSQNNYYIIIKHRDHLAVMSSGTKYLHPGTSSMYDFTSGTGQFYNGDAKQVDASPERYGMYKGDANGNGTVNATDYLFIKNKVGQSGYFVVDCNLNGTVNSTDYLHVKMNVGKSTQVP